MMLFSSSSTPSSATNNRKGTLSTAEFEERLTRFFDENFLGIFEEEFDSHSYVASVKADSVSSSGSDAVSGRGVQLHVSHLPLHCRSSW